MIQINDILLIDDDNITNFINEIVVKKMNISNNISIATSGNEGLSFVKKNCLEQMSHCPQVILLDINMPDMDGFQFLKELKAMDGKADNIQVFMLSSSLNPRDLLSSDSFYVSGYINKPLTEEKLINAMHSRTNSDSRIKLSQTV